MMSKMENNKIMETQVHQVAPSNPTGDTYDGGYVEALGALMKALQNSGGGGGGGPQPPIEEFPDPRLIMPGKKSKGGDSGDNNGPKPKNKQMDIDTGEDIEDENDGQGSESKSEQEKADNSSQNAQDAADAATKAAQEAQAQAEAAASKANDSGNAVDQKKAEKAQKAADKAKKAAEKAQKAADKAKKAAEKGDAKTATEAEMDAKDAANEAKIANNEMKHNSATEDMTAEEAAADAAESAKAAREAAEQAKAAAEALGDSEDKIAKTAKKAAERAEKAANDAEKAAADAQKAAESGNSSKALEKAQEAAQKAREAADVAKAAKNSAERAQELDNQEEAQGEYHSQGEMSERDKLADPEDLEGDLYDCTEYAQGVIDEFSKKLTGPVGEFLGKSREAIADIARHKNKEKKVNVKTYTKKAKKAWDVDFQEMIDAYVSNCIQEKKREMKSTYSRPNRRQGQVKTGDIVKKGRIVKKDKLDITMTFYIDISGSMSGSPVINAFKAAYAYSDFLKKRHGEQSVVGDFDYTYYAFNTRFHQIKNREIPRANGDNVDFNEILEYIESHSMNDMINVIITDAYFPIAVNKSCECIKRTDGLFIVIANNSRNAGDFEKMKEKLKEKFEFLQADDNFTFNTPK